MKRIIIFFTSFFLFSVFCLGQSNSIYQWHGPDRNGIYPEHNLLKEWPEQGIPLLWSVEGLGHGYSAPVVTADKLIITGEIDSLSYVFAFGLDGKLIWKSANGLEFFGKEYSATYPGSRSTPTVFNGLVYVCSGLGRLTCLDTETGAERWFVDLIHDLKGRHNVFGFSESLMVDEKSVYCSPGGEEKNIVALDRFTGKLLWSSKGMGDLAAHASPIIVKLPERNVLVTFSHKYMVGTDSGNGELLWSHIIDSVKWEGDHCNSPLYSDGYIYNIAGEKNGNGAYKLQLSADGKQVDEVWRNNKVLNVFNGFVKVSDRIYTCSQKKKLYCIDSNTGMVTDSVSNLRGSVIFADNRLYCYADNGTINLVNTDGEKMKVSGSFKIEKGTQQHFAHPVVDKGVLYIRHGDALMAYDVQ